MCSHTKRFVLEAVGAYSGLGALFLDMMLLTSNSQKKFCLS